MRDYAELLKALRCCSTIDAQNNGCDSCPYEYCGENCQKLCAYAADAIEELFGIVLTYEAANDMFKPQWFSVEERLPEYGERVLVSNGGFVCESFLSQSGKWQRGGVDMFFMTPTHWMPLPSAPKEENKR